jgi:hypothetical protein
MDLQRFKDVLSVAATGQTAAQGQAEGLCIQCKLPALPKCHTDAGRQEYHISGFCEECWDAMFDEDDEDNEPGAEVHTLTELQYADTGDGPWALYIYGRDGMHSGKKWFRKGAMKYPDEEITTFEAQRRVKEAVAKGSEVRICDGGDMLVFHAANGKILYPDSGRDFWFEAVN